MYSLVYTTLVAIQSRTYLTKAELIETNREPIVGDLVYGSDSYYAQIVRVGEGIVEITVIGQIANLQAVYDLLDLKADKTELDAYAKLAASNVFTQPQQVPNATLPQHATNKLQVETMFEMFKRELRGYNLAIPDLTGKEYLGNGVYRTNEVDGVTIDYNIYNGEYIVNGIYSSLPNLYITTLVNIPPGTYTFNYIKIAGSTMGRLFVDIWEPSSSILFSSINSNITTRNRGVATTRIGITEITNGFIFNNYKFKLQIEKGATATPYTVPGQIPQYKIVGEE